MGGMCGVRYGPLDAREVVVYSALEAAAQEFEREGERCGPEVFGCPDVGAGGRGATRETKSGTAKRMRTGARRMEGGKGASGGWTGRGRRGGPNRIRVLEMENIDFGRKFSLVLALAKLRYL